MMHHGYRGTLSKPGRATSKSRDILTVEWAYLFKVINSTKCLDKCKNKYDFYANSTGHLGNLRWPFRGFKILLTYYMCSKCVQSKCKLLQLMIMTYCRRSYLFIFYWCRSAYTCAILYLLICLLNNYNNRNSVFLRRRQRQRMRHPIYWLTVAVKNPQYLRIFISPESIYPVTEQAKIIN